ncbi:hypothetical protein CIB48_g2672 [Xylaria polymorpha]|nr:hypothetical protein CIB48_g2672 [Xylaria polymorpha]
MAFQTRAPITSTVHSGKLYLFFYDYNDITLQMAKATDSDRPSGFTKLQINVNNQTIRATNDSENLLAACSSGTSVVVFYLDRQNILHDIWSGDGGMSWSSGALSSLNIMIGRNNSITAHSGSHPRLLYTDGSGVILGAHWHSGTWTTFLAS